MADIYYFISFWHLWNAYGDISFLIELMTVITIKKDMQRTRGREKNSIILGHVLKNTKVQE